MALQIRLSDYQKAVFVAQLAEYGGVGVVTCSDCIKVMLLHHGQIRHHLLPAYGKAGQRIGIVAVHSAEYQALSVKIYGFSDNFYLAQPYMIRDNLVFRLQYQGVEIRRFRIPQNRFRDMQQQFFSSLNPFGSYKTVFPIIERCRYRDLLLNKCEIYRYLCGIIFQSCLYKIVPDSLFRAFQKVYISENAAHTEFVLILQIASVAPLKNQYGQTVFSLRNCMAYVKFACTVRYLAVADVGSVEPYVKAGIHTLKVQIDRRSFLIPLIVELPYVGPAGIVLGNIGRIKGKRVADVGVLMSVIACCLPVARYLDTGKG